MRKELTFWQTVALIGVLVVSLPATFVAWHASIGLVGMFTRPIDAKDDAWLQAIANLIGAFGGAFLAGVAAIGAAIVAVKYERARVEEARRQDQKFVSTAVGAWVGILAARIDQFVLCVRATDVPGDPRAPSAPAVFVDDEQVSRLSRKLRTVELPAEVRVRVADHFPFLISIVDDIGNSMSDIRAMVQEIERQTCITEVRSGHIWQVGSGKSEPYIGGAYRIGEREIELLEHAIRSLSSGYSLFPVEFSVMATRQILESCGRAIADLRDSVDRANHVPPPTRST